MKIKFGREILLFVILTSGILAYSSWPTLKETLTGFGEDAHTRESEPSSKGIAAQSNNEKSSISPSAEERRSCPANWVISPTPDYMKIRSIFEQKGVDVDDDQPLLNAADGSLQSAFPGTLMGNITLSLSGNSYVNIDGKHLVGVSTIDLKDTKNNVVNILAPGLATVPGEVTISGSGKDNKIYLDGCIDWSSPEDAKHDGQTFSKVTAKDKDGRTVSVYLPKNIKTEILKPKQISKWLQASLIPRPPGVKKGEVSSTLPPKNNSNSQDNVIFDASTKLTHQQALDLYQRMIDALPEKPKATMQLLVDLMKKGQMPVFYPSSHVLGDRYFEPLQFNPKGVVNLSTQDFKECGGHSAPFNVRGDWIEDCMKGKCPPSTEVGVVR